MKLFAALASDGASAVGPLRWFWFGDEAGASAQASHTENLYLFIMWVCLISFAILMALLGYFVVKFRRGKQATNYQVSASHNTPLELMWSIIPLLIMVPIFYWGFEGYIAKLASPSDAEEIQVVGKQWKWSFTYRNGAEPMDPEIPQTKSGITVPYFVVPKDRAVRLIMRSSDVIHAFYIPDFRTKMDVIPNRYISMWFKPEKLGKHNVFCAEYCGQDHSEMGAIVEVLEREAYEAKITAWASGFPDDWSLAKVGQALWSRKGCNACHSIDGSKSTGPTWKDMYGEQVEFADGKVNTAQQMADPAFFANYVHESIINPGKQVVKGYGNQMSSFAGQISDAEIDALILYMKTLSSHGTAEDKAKSEKPWGEEKNKKPS